MCENYGHAKCAEVMPQKIELIQNGYDFFNCAECDGFYNHLAYPMLRELFFEPPKARATTAAKKMELFLNEAEKKPCGNLRNKLAVLSANINGLRNKLDVVKERVDTYEPDVFLLQETKIDAFIKSQ
jgi:hypothetical protein